MPREHSDFSQAPPQSISSQFTSAKRESADMGRTCSTLKRCRPSDSRSAANSISTSHFISSRAISRRVRTMSASGKVLYLRIPAKVMYFGPSGNAESTIRILLRSQVETTFPSEGKPEQSSTVSLARLTESLTEVLNFSGRRSIAYIVLWVSRRVRSGVEVCSTCLGYLGEKRSTCSPSTTAFPRPYASFTMPSSGFSCPTG